MENRHSLDDIENEIKDIIISIADFELDRSMISTGANGIRKLGLNSLSLLRLLAKLEQHFDIKTEPDETDSEVLASVENMAGYIRRKKRGSS